MQGHRSCASTARLNLLLRCLFAVCTGCEGILMRALLQGEEEEAAPEKPAKKPVREEDVFAGNKNLRSEDVKFREMHDDRCAGSCPENPALAWPAQHGFRAQPAWEWGRLTSAHGLQEKGDCRSQHLAATTLFHGTFIKKPLYSWTSAQSQMQRSLPLHCEGACRKKQKENQEDLLAKANQETMRALKSSDGTTAVTAGRKVSAVEAYRRVEDIPTSRELAIMVRISSEMFSHLLSGTGCLTPARSTLLEGVSGQGLPLG